MLRELGCCNQNFEPLLFGGMKTSIWVACLLNSMLKEWNITKYHKYKRKIINHISKARLNWTGGAVEQKYLNRCILYGMMCRIWWGKHGEVAFYISQNLLFVQRILAMSTYTDNASSKSSGIFQTTNSKCSFMRFTKHLKSTLWNHSFFLFFFILLRSDIAVLVYITWHKL